MVNRCFAGHKGPRISHVRARERLRQRLKSILGWDDLLSTARAKLSAATAQSCRGRGADFIRQKTVSGAFKSISVIRQFCSDQPKSHLGKRTVKAAG